MAKAVLGVGSYSRTSVAAGVQGNGSRRDVVPPWLVPLLVGVLLGACTMTSPGSSDLPGPALSDRPSTVEEFLRLEARPRVIAHRGASDLAPENTLAAFRKAIELGADMIELDVLLSQDGHVVVIHDDTLDRTSNGRGKVASLALDQLRKLDAGTWYDSTFAREPIPTLEESLRLVKGKILLNVEIKTEAVTDETRGGIAEKVVRLVHGAGMRDVVIISSFDPRALSQVREIDPLMITASLFNRDLHSRRSPLEVMEEVGARAFNISKSRVTAKIVEECHKSGRPVAVYTVNEPAEMRRLMDLGVNALFTNRPDLMIELLVSR